MKKNIINITGLINDWQRVQHEQEHSSRGDGGGEGSPIKKQ